ncbi:MAG: alpha-mannosidase [Bacteroidetes bacterium RBG_13_43_22]|nr:MAG: alpha-mannosidase [Bacteroidetes bacterium RBG_13_43_22]
MCQLTLIISLFVLSGCNNSGNFIKYADPFIGSIHCRWFFFTPASVPMGMAKLGPHTDAHYGNQGGWEPVGYDFRHASIEGFGHFHEFQIGGLVIMPTVGELLTVPGDLKDTISGYRSGFKKETEKAEPGYYSVELEDYKILVELTATERVGFHRYTFPASKQSRILFDVGNRQGESGPVIDASVRYTDQNEIEGYIVTYPVYVENYHPECDVKMYFVAKLNRNPDNTGVFVGDSIIENGNSIRGKGAGLYLTFGTYENEIIEIMVGLSYTSIENARKNLIAETEDRSFNMARSEAQKKWNEMLGIIEVKGSTDENLVKFYTGLYHVLLGRGISNDVDGSYPKCSGEIGKIPLDKNGKPQYSHFNSDATWGAFWNLEQVWALAYPEILSDYVKCHLDYYNDCGWLPDGIAQGCYVPGVPSNFLSVAIASAWNHGIRDFDIEKAFEAIKKNETGWQERPVGVGKYDVKDFIENGYIPNDVIWRGWKFSGSHTLEYCFSSYAASELAIQLDKEEDYQHFRRLAEGYKNLFDHSIMFMRPKERDSSFVVDFTPEMVWNGFQEGNSWQYSWYVPHDVSGLISIMGSDNFNNKLDSIFSESEKLEFGGGKKIHSFSGLEAVYNHGNQPSLHISFLFNYSGKPWLTQKWTRKICDSFYGITPLHGYGYGQDEDQGQLGAWFVLASMGLFDVQGGANRSPTYQLGSPVFDEIVIHLDSKYYQRGKFKIKVNRTSENSTYIDHALLNGKELNKPWIYHDELIRGGILELLMSDAPNKNWCQPDYIRPPSMSDE